MLIQTMEYAVAHGLTSVQSNDVGTSFMDGPAAFAMFKDLYDKGEALIRYRHQVCFNDLEDFEKYLEEGTYKLGTEDEDCWLKIGPLEAFLKTAAWVQERHCR